MTYKLTALSLGAGVQSSTILLMACKGELPKPDFAIFADTGWESQVTYKHLDWLEQEARGAGIPILKVSSGNILDNLLTGEKIKGQGQTKFVDIPFYCQDNNGNRGMGKRQCTRHYKLLPISREIRNLLGLKRGRPLPQGAVELWIGISIDEATRANISRDKLITNKFPLLDIKRMSRIQCQLWLEQNYDGLVIPKSSCIGCPFHNNRDWQRIKSNEKEWESALEADNAIRESVTRVGFTNYLHNSCQPLNEIDLRTPQEKGQLELDFGKIEKLRLFGNLEI